MLNKSKSYLLNEGEGGKHNLNLQHAILHEVTFNQLQKGGLKEGMVIWDVGCGSGDVTEMIAENVGSDGKVYAADISEEQLNVTRQRMDNKGYKNVEYINESIEKINPDEYENADLVHSRFLLMHVQDVSSILTKMAELLKPGGVVVSQESSMDSLRNKSSCKSIDSYFDLMNRYGRKKGLNFNVGSTLEKFFINSGPFQDIKTEKTRISFDSENGKKLLLSRLDEIKDRLIEEKLTDRAAIMQIKDDIEQYVQVELAENSVIYTEQTHILAKVLDLSE